MPSCWRLTKTRHQLSAWTGEVARRVGGRWNSPGTPVVYASEALSLALVEVLVHLPPGLLPSYSAIPARYEEGLALTLALEALAEDWRRTGAARRHRPRPRPWATPGPANGAV